MSLLEFIIESNAIEDIHDGSAQLVPMYRAFLDLPAIRVEDMCNAVNAFQPGAQLRGVGMDVAVGNHVAPAGGPRIRTALACLLGVVNTYPEADPFRMHRRYEHLHPFTDGNGRSGRLLWLWQMHKKGWQPIGPSPFLRQWYYRSLAS